MDLLGFPPEKILYYKIEPDAYSFTQHYWDNASPNSHFFPNEDFPFIPFFWKIDKTWQEFKDKGLDLRFKVIDDSDIQDTVIQTPQTFTEPVSFIEETIRDEVLTREELKAALDTAEVDYNPRISTDKLNQLYLDNKL